MFLWGMCVISSFANFLIGQNKVQLFSKSEFEHIASIFVKTQIVFEQMQKEYEVIFKGNRAMNNSGNFDSDIEYKKSIHESAQKIDTREYINLEHYSDSCYLKSNKILVLNYSQTAHYGSKNYIVAFSEEGAMYFMRGFYKCDFERLLKDKLKTIKDVEEFKKTLHLYLETVKYSDYTREIIDNNNLKEYIKNTRKIAPLSIEKEKNGSYKATYYTVEFNETTSGKTLFYNSFIITPKLKVKSFSKEVAKI